MIHYSCTLRNGDKIFVVTDFTTYPPSFTSTDYSSLSLEYQEAFDEMISWAGSLGLGFPSVVPPPDEITEDIVDTVTIVKIDDIIESVVVYVYDTDTETDYDYSSLDSNTQAAATLLST